MGVCGLVKSWIYNRRDADTTVFELVGQTVETYSKSNETVGVNIETIGSPSTVIGRKVSAPSTEE